MDIYRARRRGNIGSNTDHDSIWREVMFSFLKRKSTKDLLEEMVVELHKDRHYIIVVPEDADPVDIVDSGFFDDYSVFIIQANKLTILEIE